MDVANYVWTLYFVKTLMKWRIPKTVTLSVETCFFLNSWLVWLNLTSTSRPSALVLPEYGETPVSTAASLCYLTAATNRHTYTLPTKKALGNKFIASFPRASCHHCGGTIKQNFTNKDSNSPTCLTGRRLETKTIQNWIHSIFLYGIWAKYSPFSEIIKCFFNVKRINHH